MRWGRRGSETLAAIEDIRTALIGVRDALDLTSAYEALVIGAARVSGADGAFLFLEHGGAFTVAASAGRVGKERGHDLLQQLTAAGGLPSQRRGPAGPIAAPVRWGLATGALAVREAPDGAEAALGLFADLGGALVDLVILRGQAAANAHLLHAPERLPGLVASLVPGDGVLVVAIAGIDTTAGGVDQIAGQSLRQAVVAHLLNGTRPPGDLVASISDDEFLIVVRDLKAPVLAVVERLQTSWLATKPVVPLSIGGALHELGSQPLDTLARAEAALASATRIGVGHAHVAPALVRQVARQA